MSDDPELPVGVVDDDHGFSLGWGNGPAAAQKVDLAVGVDPAAGLDCQVQIEEGGCRTGAGGRAVFGHRLVPSLIGG